MNPPVKYSKTYPHSTQFVQIYVNTLTTQTVFSCRLVHAECIKNLKDSIEINAAHILAQSQGAEMSAEQAREIREAFDNFDKDKSGGLSFKEFTDGLQVSERALRKNRLQIDYNHY